MKTFSQSPLEAQLTHRPFPELAEALRLEISHIVVEWDSIVRQAMPQMRHLSFHDVEDSTPQILLAIADSLASDDPQLIRGLMHHAPAQGLSRLALHFDVVEVMEEDRLLRAVTVEIVEARLGRRMDVPESAALHAAIDVMLQRSVIALVDEQKIRLRAAAETELKFLSFMSHDLNQNLGSVTLWLRALEGDLKQADGFADAKESLANARRSIADTVSGMRQMLDHERLRKGGRSTAPSQLDLHAVATQVMGQFTDEARGKGLRLAIDVLPGTVFKSQGELLSIVLQNLVGNAVKYSDSGTVRLGCDLGHEPGHFVPWVSDEGPGIAPDQISHIFEAFRRGDVHGQLGVGLGLAIASQAAKLLGGNLTVESQPGIGSNFRLDLRPHMAQQIPSPSVMS